MSIKGDWTGDRIIIPAMENIGDRMGPRVRLERKLEQTRGRKGEVFFSPPWSLYQGFPTWTDIFFAKRLHDLRGQTRTTSTYLFGEQGRVAIFWKLHNQIKIGIGYGPKKLSNYQRVIPDVGSGTQWRQAQHHSRWSCTTPTRHETTVGICERLINLFFNVDCVSNVQISIPIVCLSFKFLKLAFFCQYFPQSMDIKHS